MNGYDLLAKEHVALQEEVKELRELVNLLMREREERIEHEIACLRTLKEWDEYNKAEAAANGK